MGNLLYTDDYLKGKKFHFLSYVSFSHRDNKHNAYCKWKCKLCGNITTKSASNVVSGRQKSCGCLKHITGEKNPLWGGFGDITGLFWRRILDNAKTRNLSVKITIKDGWNQFLKQKRKCALTGEPIFFSSNKKLSDGTASLDRINSSVAYKGGNFQWVHKRINYIKRNLAEKEFVELCKKVSKHHDP